MVVEKCMEVKMPIQDKNVHVVYARKEDPNLGQDEKTEINHPHWRVLYKHTTKNIDHLFHIFPFFITYMEGFKHTQ